MYILKMMALVGVLGSFTMAWAEDRSEAHKRCIEKCDGGLIDCTSKYEGQPDNFAECNKGQVDCVKVCKKEREREKGRDVSSDDRSSDKRDDESSK